MPIICNRVKDYSVADIAAWPSSQELGAYVTYISDQSFQRTLQRTFVLRAPIMRASSL